MAYHDLPAELWEEILNATSVPTAVNFLATAREVRRDLFAPQEDRLQAAQRGQQQIQAWITQRALERVKEQKESFGLTTITDVISPTLSQLLGTNFPRIRRDAQELAVTRQGTLSLWVFVYVKMNGLVRGTELGARATFIIDANLAALSGYPEGSEQPRWSLDFAIGQRNTLPDLKPVLTPEQEEQIQFNYYYLFIILSLFFGDSPEKRDFLAAGFDLQYLTHARLRSPPARV